VYSGGFCWYPDLAFLAVLRVQLLTSGSIFGVYGKFSINLILYTIANPSVFKPHTRMFRAILFVGYSLCKVIHTCLTFLRCAVGLVLELAHVLYLPVFRCTVAEAHYTFTHPVGIAARHILAQPLDKLVQGFGSLSPVTRITTRDEISALV